MSSIPPATEVINVLEPAALSSSPAPSSPAAVPTSSNSSSPSTQTPQIIAVLNFLQSVSKPGRVDVRVKMSDNTFNTIPLHSLPMTSIPVLFKSLETAFSNIFARFSIDRLYDVNNSICNNSSRDNISTPGVATTTSQSPVITTQDLPTPLRNKLQQFYDQASKASESPQTRAIADKLRLRIPTLYPPTNNNPPQLPIKQSAPQVVTTTSPTTSRSTLPAPKIPAKQAVTAQVQQPLKNSTPAKQAAIPASPRPTLPPAAPPKPL